MTIPAMTRVQVKALVSGENMFKGPRSQILQLSPETQAKIRAMQEAAAEKKAQQAADAAAAQAAADAAEAEAERQAAWDALPNVLDFKTNQITFNNGCPVGGWAEIRLYKNGNYEFWGHFHDSGAPSYDAGIGWVIVDNEGQGFSFEAKVHLNGTFESGSRDGDWHQTGNRPEINQHWANLCAGSHAKWSANVNWDWGILVKQITDGLKTAGTFVGGVVAVVALL
jgi:hypothetical protein